MTKLHDLIQHDTTDECPVCRAQEFAQAIVLPACASWEMTNGFERFTLALNSAAYMLGAMLEEGVPRAEVETTLGELLDDIEMQIAEDEQMGGPPQGTA
jgi:hypothetical protein